MNSKRPRSANFSSEEKLYCLNLIKKYKHIIENKETGGQSWKEKENVWKIIEEEFNSQASIYRSADVLKRFYNNRKKETRKQAAQQKIEMNKTGGGTSKTIDDPIYNLTLDIINKKTVFGLENKFDDDSTTNVNAEDTTVLIDNSIKEYESTMENEDENEIIILKVGDEADKAAIGECTNNWSTCAAKKLQTSTSKTPQNQKETLQNEWSNRRRPQVSKTNNIALQYEEVADMKKEVLQMQLSILSLQKQELQEKMEWEKKQRQLQEQERDIFELRKQGFILDLEIKKQQLKALNSVNL